MTLFDEICTVKSNYGPVSGFFVLILEYFFGKTIYGSAIGFAINLVKRPFTKGVTVLEGKEIDQKIGQDGEVSLDVDDKGQVDIELSYAKDLGFAKAKVVSSLSVSIFDVAEMVAKKTATTWDDQAIAALENLLGIKKA